MYFLKKFFMCDAWFLSLVLLLGGLLGFSVFNFNNLGVFYIGQKQYQKAQGFFLKTLKDRAFSPLPRMNLAFSYSAGGEFKKSLQEYEAVRILLPESNTTFLPADDVLFYTFFNSAVVAARENKPLEALNFYQQALFFKPQSLKVKTNMELLLKNSSSGENKKQKNKETSPPSSSDQKKQSSSPSSSRKKQDPSSKKDKKSKLKKDREQGETPDQAENPPPMGRQKTPSEAKTPSHLSPQQVEALLKAIEEQEKQIRKKRIKPSSPLLKPSQDKDW